MKAIVIGGTGLAGRHIVAALTAAGHDASAASPSRGVDAYTGEGLADALKGADIVVDASNSPSQDEAQASEFFRTSTRNLLAAERDAGVRHHVLLSIVGVDRIPDFGYYNAKVAQEQAVESGYGPGVVDGTPAYSIVRATQFFEYVTTIMAWNTDGETVRLSGQRFQPLALDDLAHALVDVAAGTPTRGIVEIAGPEVLHLDDAARRILAAHPDGRTVTADPGTRPLGVDAESDALTAGADARLGATDFATWLARGDR